MCANLRHVLVGSGIPGGAAMAQTDPGTAQIGKEWRTTVQAVPAPLRLLWPGIAPWMYPVIGAEYAVKHDRERGGCHESDSRRGWTG